MTDTSEPGRLRAHRRRRPERSEGDAVELDRVAPRIGYLLMALSTFCFSTAAGLMFSPAAALVPIAVGLAVAGWDAARG